MHEDNRNRYYTASAGQLTVLTAYHEMQQSGDMSAPFLQESSFWWLTGITEPGWKLILDATHKQAVLVRPHRSEIDIIFNGAMSDEAIAKISGIGHIIAEKEFEGELRQRHRSHAIAYTIAPSHSGSGDVVANPAQTELHETLARIFDSVQDCSRTLSSLRAVKQPHELDSMQRAIDLTVRAFKDVRDNLNTLSSENEVEAEFIYRFRRAGATHAYEPIVASGANACTLHYIANDRKIGARDMVLIDIGARVDGYAADITRTYCRRPTKRQRAVHEAVQKAQQRVIDLIEPGLLVSDYIRQSDTILKEALHGLGLLDDMSDEKTFRTYFPHAMSHGLGVDTHDSLGAPRYFEPGMVITVEPGIYIPEERIGVRIEDDILVTADGHKNLSAKLSTEL